MNNAELKAWTKAELLNELNESSKEIARLKEMLKSSRESENNLNRMLRDEQEKVKLHGRFLRLIETLKGIHDDTPF